jgi:hypothetical protein
MIHNRVEELAGYRWAKDTCIDFGNLLGFDGGHAKLMEMLRRGLVEKPPSYAVGVQKVIKLAEEVRP